MNRQYVPNYKDCVYRYTQWHQGAFLKDIAGMNIYEVGIYTILINQMYDRGEALFDDVNHLARLCGVDKRSLVKALDVLIKRGKIIRLDCGLWSEECEESFTIRAKMRAAKQGAGRTSAEKRNKINDQFQHVFNRCSTSKSKSNIDISSLRSDISYAQNRNFERFSEQASEDFEIEDFGLSESLGSQTEGTQPTATGQAEQAATQQQPPPQEPERQRTNQATAAPPGVPRPAPPPPPLPEPSELPAVAATATEPPGVAFVEDLGNRAAELMRAWEAAAAEELERERRASEIEAMDAAGTPPAVAGDQTRPQAVEPPERERERRTSEIEAMASEAVARPQVAASRLEPAPSRLEFEPGGVTGQQRRRSQPVATAEIVAPPVAMAGQAVAAPVERRAPSKSGAKAAQKLEFEREFDEVFWPAVVRKVGKASAKKAFPKARAKASLGEIMAGLGRYQSSRAAKGVDIQFWAHPTTFLNAERWEDEPDPTIINTRTNNHEQHRRNATQKGGHNRPRTFTEALYYIDERLEYLQSRQKDSAEVPADVSVQMWFDDRGEEDDDGQYPTIDALPFIDCQQGTGQSNFV